uniref:IS6 family transposase n=1 Tax=Echinostoma caproni TaxID=27848 RepID=A0A183BG20_9TREM
LTSGLLIEQTAHCVLRMRRPMLRKFGFRLALAAHRYNRARQVTLSLI